MHAAAASKSERLKRVLRVLSDGAEHSTRDIIINADVCAVNSCIAELRQNGAVITCEQRREDGARRFFYTMTKGPDDE